MGLNLEVGIVADLLVNDVREFFRVDPAELRASDLARYLQLGRVATGEAMAGRAGVWGPPSEAKSGPLLDNA